MTHAIRPARHPTSRHVPALAVDDNRIVLVWQKPVEYAQVVYCQVHQYDQLMGSAGDNVAQFSPTAHYFQAFYVADPGARHVKVDQHSFTVDGLLRKLRFKGYRGQGDALT